MSDKNTIRLEELSLNPEKYYFLFPAHHGDTFRGAGFIREFEKEKNTTVVCLIRPSQEFIMRLFEIKEYELIDEDWKESPIFWNKITALSDLCPRPRKGGVFIAFPLVHKEFYNFIHDNDRHRMQLFAYMFRLEAFDKDIFQRPTIQHISVSNDFIERISQIAPLNKLVLLSPESLSWNEMLGKDEMVKKYWKKEASLWKQRGYKVLISSVKSVQIEGATWMDMTMEEAVWLGIHCHHVTALRSGYADCISFFCKDLTVVYNSYTCYAVNNFYDAFNLEINEIILPGNELRNADGVPLSLAADIKNLNKLKKVYQLTRILSHIAIGKSKRKYRKEKKELKSRILEAEKTARLLYANCSE